MNENGFDRVAFISKCEEIAMFWKDKMPMLAMEESGELIQAISKMERARIDHNPDEITRKANYEFAKKYLISEIGDMYISLMALQIFYADDLSTEDLSKHIKEKLNKKYD